ncbi:hypothetical protein HYPSUDRAFT_72134 [Hypholoma sublateritium FD-334 SS-4]|uniref:DUF7137 domain-containing protein n=1 Tax=Hypholoma sublateritium (strain FD-334 SS-4) TaxID=945553 RepID=A0A0D2N859_HYPSF|nr:hypothetical protein HYPSUDRAFT_72134 [Hypholoma sublateritium FD-334 SS-4]
MSATTSTSSTAATSSSSSFSLVHVPQTAPAGGITITKPQQTATSFFKIASGEPITFAWNMTSVLVMPTHLTISAVCQNGNTYAVGPTDGIIPATQTEVVWDLYAYQTNNPSRPLAQATYTLNIWDERGPGAARKAGYLSPNTGLEFALYTPQAYTPLASGWTCTTCSGGSMSYITHPAFVSLIITFFIVFMSGLHLLRSSTRPS